MKKTTNSSQGLSSMNVRRRLHLSLVSLTVGGLLAGACSPQEAGSNGSGGTTSASGGNSGSGGSTASGGSTSSGGTTSSGGATTSSGGSTASGGIKASGGATASGGTTASGGATSSGGAGGGKGGATGTGGVGGKAGTGGAGGAAPKFSFFVTSLAAMTRLSKKAGATDDLGFGGDLRYGETGAGAGLRGADKICTEIAEDSMPGAGAKTWHAFLSTVEGPVHAKDRIGTGPWYDRKGRLLASNLTQLLMERPGDADAAIKNDLPNEDGIPNQNPDLTKNVDNHDILTGTNTMGMLYNSTDRNRTCNDWTSKEGLPAGGGAGGSSGGGMMMIGMGKGPWCGHSWPFVSGMNWMSSLAEGGCAPGINLVQSGGPKAGELTVGTGGGYGGIYCFALTP